MDTEKVKMRHVVYCDRCGALISGNQYRCSDRYPQIVADCGQPAGTTSAVTESSDGVLF